MGDYGTPGAGENGGQEENFHCERPIPVATIAPVNENTIKTGLDVEKVDPVVELASQKSISIEDTSQNPVPIVKPDGMSKDAASTYDLMSAEPKQKKIPRSKSIQTRINKIENKLSAKMNKIFKRRHKNAQAKKSRRKNRKK